MSRALLEEIGLPSINLRPANTNFTFSGDMVSPPYHPVLKREDAVIQEFATDEAENRTEEQQENITFGDTTPAAPQQFETVYDRTRFCRDDEIAHLGAYLSRPVLINVFTWTQSTTGTDLNNFLPWKLFFNDSHIKAKLNNYARIQCSLKLKFILNASPFHYGLLKVNYNPMNEAQDQGAGLLTKSQMPGPYIAPQEMSSVEFEAPFFWPRDSIDACSVEDFNAIGAVNYSVFEELASANAATAGSITISCYAWAENVHLSAPTSYSAIQGPISKVAQKVSNVASALSSVPPLASVAASISTGASLVSNVATALGFSNSPNVSDVQAVQVKSTPAFANTEQRVPLDKLSLDPNNEVSLTPITTGLGETDELAITEFCGHESWIGGTQWDSSDTSGMHLMSMFVTPHMQNETVYSNPAYVQYDMTPTRYLTRWFRYWRGSMIYRIKVIGTQFHKGRLQISWDPEDDCSGNADTETTTITKIVDLDAEREIEFIVPYKGVRCWNNTSFSDVGGMPIKYGSGSWIRTPNKSEHNGCLSIFVQNQLTGPIDPASVRILVFARAGPDFEVAAPCEPIRRYTVNSIQGPEPKSLDGGKVPDEKLVPTYTVGERTSSIRQLLHRTVFYSLNTRLWFQGTTPSEYPIPYALTAHFPKMPNGFGYTAKGVDFSYGQTTGATTTTYRTNLVNEVPLNTFANCFAGYRGSVNWHAVPIFQDDSDRPLMDITRVSGTHLLNAIPANATAFTDGNSLQTTTVSAYPMDHKLSMLATKVTTSGGRVRHYPHGNGGSSLTNTAIQPYVSVNIPQYSNIRFQTAFEKERDRVTASDTVYDSFKVSSLQVAKPTANRYYNLYVSGGTDFNLFFFVCCPRLYTYEIPLIIP